MIFISKTDNRGSRGFTLIELLIVIAIVGILASAVLFSTNSANKNAKATAAKQVIIGLKSAIYLCCINPSNSIAQWDGASPATQTVCSDGTGPNYPTAAQLNATDVKYTSSDSCSIIGSSPAVGVHIWGHSKTGCNENAATYAGFTIGVTVGTNYFKVDDKGIDPSKITSC